MDNFKSLVIEELMLKLLDEHYIYPCNTTGRVGLTSFNQLKLHVKAISAIILEANF